MLRRVKDPLIRFYDKTQWEGDCLIWKASHSGHAGPNGTGRRPTFRPGRSAPKVYAHRWIYTQRVGPIPIGYEIDHLCRKGSCVRIDHLEAVTPRENQRRTQIALCRKGLHDLTDPKNIRIEMDGYKRRCRLCHNSNQLRCQRAKRERLRAETRVTR